MGSEFVDGISESFALKWPFPPHSLSHAQAPHACLLPFCLPHQQLWGDFKKPINQSKNFPFFLDTSEVLPLLYFHGWYGSARKYKIPSSPSKVLMPNVHLAYSLGSHELCALENSGISNPSPTVKQAGWVPPDHALPHQRMQAMEKRLEGNWLKCNSDVSTFDCEP